MRRVRGDLQVCGEEKRDKDGNGLRACEQKETEPHNHPQKVQAEDKTNIESAIASLKTALEGTDKSEIDSKTQALAEASSKLAEKAYAASAEGPEPVDANAKSDSESASDDVVDAEFEEVKDEDKK